MQRTRRMMTIFTNKFPLLGPIVWVLSTQYFAAQVIVANAWQRPFQLSVNPISDLGNTVCGDYTGRFVCSPQHDVMNVSFILLGLTMALGAGLIYQEFRPSRVSLIGFTMMGLAGVGTFLVGVFPENTISLLHQFGALLALGVGNAGLIVLGLGLRRVRRWLRIYTFLTGIIALSAFILFVLKLDGGIGLGTIERIASYPQTIWLILFGFYMTASHVRRRKAT